MQSIVPRLQNTVVSPESSRSWVTERKKGPRNRVTELQNACLEIQRVAMGETSKVHWVGGNLEVGERNLLTWAKFQVCWGEVHVLCPYWSQTRCVTSCAWLSSGSTVWNSRVKERPWTIEPAGTEFLLGLLDYVFNGRLHKERWTLLPASPRPRRGTGSVHGETKLYIDLEFFLLFTKQ